MQIKFTNAPTVEEATHFFHLRDSVVFPKSEYRDRYPMFDAVLPMVLTVEQEDQCSGPADKRDALKMMFSVDGAPLRAYARAGHKASAVIGLRRMARDQGFTELRLSHAHAAVNEWLAFQEGL